MPGGGGGSQGEGETGSNEARDREWEKAKESEENPSPRGRSQVSLEGDKRLLVPLATFPASVKSSPAGSQACCVLV